ncbi:MAG: Recombinase protein [Patescibacteria group bacterium]|nr:Recombinase protein [Patescibacteria group bacterium]
MEVKTKYLIYLRKSTDSEDRQIQSIEDQKKELQKIASQFKLEIKGTYQESHSAKKPGRPEFNKMIADIKRGRANGILCWKINRLTRNPTDSGTLQQLLQDGIIQSIQTAGREYKTDDNVLIMSVETGMANQYIQDLRRDVKRGMLSKAEKGWRPGLAPIGYKNDRGGKQGSKIIHVDEEKFPIVRKMWDLMLTGEYSVPKIIDIANNEWGLRKSSAKGDTKLHESHGYKIFNNPFYYGKYDWVGKTYQGHHTPMITPAEFDYVQKLLGIKSKPQTRHKDLPYRGTIRCGECGCHITTEQKIKRIKSDNTIKTYLYHHCTNKKIDIDCQQKSITFEEINRQVMEKLDKITLPANFLDFALKILKRDNELEINDRNTLIKSQQRAFNDCQKRLDNLYALYISRGNTNKELLNDDELKTQKSYLLKEKAEIEQQLDNLSQRADEWLELTEKTFKFAIYAKHNFNEGDYETKTSILRALGSNFVLKDGKVDITLRKQYQLIENALESISVKTPRLELTDFALSETKTAHSKAVFETMSG